jgi:drug/metabolite transporter (DMT)-like permease
MQHQTTQPVFERPSPLPYAAERRRRPIWGVAGLACSLVTPCGYLLLIAMTKLGRHPGYDAALMMVFAAFMSGIAGVCLCLLSFRRESNKVWGVAGLVLSVPGICFNCFALGNA